MLVRHRKEKSDAAPATTPFHGLIDVGQNSKFNIVDNYASPTRYMMRLWFWLHGILV
jgi:hypothetical protein